MFINNIIMGRRSRSNITFVKVAFYLSIFLFIYLLYSTVTNTLYEINKKKEAEKKNNNNSTFTNNIPNSINDR